jgi:hypothetical protein
MSKKLLSHYNNKMKPNSTILTTKTRRHKGTPN